NGLHFICSCNKGSSGPNGSAWTHLNESAVCDHKLLCGSPSHQLIIRQNPERLSILAIVIFGPLAFQLLLVWPHNISFTLTNTVGTMSRDLAKNDPSSELN
ncbi:hypothetical protein VP01_6951g1, partial [Puccinia sorghi]